MKRVGRDVASREPLALARLCLGADAEAIRALGPVDWALVRDRAQSERCVGLAWLRGAATLREAAPQEVVAAWRSDALAFGLRAREQLGELSDLLDLLERHGVVPIVLKGFPLAQRLYGDPYVRPVADTDLYVPLHQRAAAHDALLAGGFRHRFGIPPAEGAYERTGASASPFVEVHSAVLDEELLSGLQLPLPEATPVEVEGVRMYTVGGPLLPVFLAVHLAKHTTVPLLWWIDFATLWQGLSPAERTAARTLAREHAAGRFLSWAEQGVRHLARLTDGPIETAAGELAALGALHRRHVALRVTALGGTLAARAASLLAWVWPPQLRRSPGRYLEHVAMRIAQIARRGFRAVRRQPPAIPVRADLRTLALSDAELLDLARSVVAAGGTMWIRARGRSMMPTIPDGAMVLIAPLGARAPSKGDVVLASFPGGKVVMHRVREVRADSIVLRGDAMVADDIPITPPDVVGRVGLVQLYDRARAPTLGAVASLRMTAARLRRSVARLLPAAP